MLPACSRLKGLLQYEHPNYSLYTFTGVMDVEGAPKFSVGPQNVILRGCMLRRWVFAWGDMCVHCRRLSHAWPLL